MKGQTIIEVIVAVAIFAVLSTSALFLILGSFESVRYGGEQEMALTFASEGIDAVRSIVNQGWGKLLFGGPYGVSSASGYWQLFGTGDTLGKFSRTINVDQVYRDGSGNIVPSGSLDPRTKKVTSEVSWETVVGRPNIISLISYFSLWGSLIWQETTTADFSDGTFTDTQVASIGDGAVTLAGAVGPGFACISPTATYDTPDVQDGMDVFVLGTRGYLVTENSPGAGAELYIFDLTDQKDPQLLGSLNLGDRANGIVVSGSYAYIASESNTQELQIVDISNPALPILVGTYNAPGNFDGLEVALSDATAYLVTQNNPSDSEFYIINVSSPTSPTLISSLEIGSAVNSVQISGNYAYLATGLDAGEMTVVDVSVPTTPSIAATLDLPSNFDGQDLYLMGNFIYLVTNNVSAEEFYIIDITTPTAPTLTGSLDIGGVGSGNAVTAYGTNAFVGTNINDKEIVVIDITNPASPQILSWVGAGGIVNSLYYANNTLYAASAYNDAEFQIYEYETEVSWRCHYQAGVYDSLGGSDGQDVFVVGSTAYLVTTNNSGVSPELYILDISIPESPTLLGSLDLGNGANGIYVFGNYAYIASSHNSQELQIVNILNPTAPVLVGSYNAPTNTDANDILIDGNYAYLVTSNSSAQEFYKIDISTPSAPTLTSSLEIGGDVYSLYIAGSYAYLATGLNSAELTVVNLAASPPAVVGSYNAPGNQDGKGIFADGSVAYLVTDPGPGDEFYTLDISTPSSPTLLGSVSWGISAATYAIEVWVYGSTAFVGVNQAGSAVKIFDVSNPASPSLQTVIVDVGGGALGLFYANDSLYVASDNNDAEFQIYNRITGGGGGPGGFTTSGTYISSAFDATASASWSFIFWSEATCPDPACDVWVQIRTATTLAGLSGAEWSGPEGKDGDETDWFTNSTGEAIHSDHNNDQFIQYRAYFTGPGDATPVIEDISVEYEI